GVYVRDPGVLRQAADVPDDVRPRFAAVARDLEVAVVRAGPDEVRVFRRLADRVDGRVHLRRRVVHGDAARLLLLLLFGVVRRQVGRDALPGLPVVARAEEELRADVDGALLRGTQVNRRVPVVAELALLVLRERLEGGRLVGLSVDAPDVAALRLGVEVVGVRGVNERPEAVA